MTADGRLLHAWREGEAKAPATANDYANMIRAALALANVTGKPDYIAQAQDWAGVLDTHYWANELGGYYFAADDTGDLIVRPFSGQDEATPNANGVMVSNLVALYLWTGEARYRDRAEAILRGFAGAMSENVLAHSGLLAAAIDSLAPALIVLIVPEGGDAGELRRALKDVSLPNAVVQEVRARGVVALLVPGARQDRDRQQAHRLCVPRPAMLVAGDRPCGTRRHREDDATSDDCLTPVVTLTRACHKARQDALGETIAIRAGEGEGAVQRLAQLRIELLLQPAACAQEARLHRLLGNLQDLMRSPRRSSPSTSRRTNTVRKFSGNLPIARSSNLATCPRMVSASGEGGSLLFFHEPLPIVADVGHSPLRLRSRVRRSALRRRSKASLIDDARQPGRQRRCAGEIAQCRERFEITVLHRLFRLGAILEHAPGRAVEALIVAPRDEAHGLGSRRTTSRQSSMSLARS